MALGTTVGNLVDRVRRDSLLASRGPVYTLGGDIASDATTLTLNETPTHIGMGSVLAIDYELFYVQAMNAGTKTATVLPGYYGSTSAAHVTGAHIEVDARFPAASIADYAEQEILSWGKELWRVTPVDLDVLSTGRSYDLGIPPGEEVYFVLDSRLVPTGSIQSYWNFSWNGDAWPHASAKLLRNMPLADYPSGYAVQLVDHPRTATTLRIVIAQPFDTSAFVPATDLVGDVGLHPSWLDIVELGAKWRAVQSTAMGRSDWRTSGHSRAAEEISPGDIMRMVEQLATLRQVRFAKAATELRADHPYRESR